MYFFYHQKFHQIYEALRKVCVKRWFVISFLSWKSLKRFSYFWQKCETYSKIENIRHIYDCNFCAFYEMYVNHSTCINVCCFVSFQRNFKGIFRKNSKRFFWKIYEIMHFLNANRSIFSQFWSILLLESKKRKLATHHLWV